MPICSDWSCVHGKLKSLWDNSISIQFKRDGWCTWANCVVHPSGRPRQEQISLRVNWTEWIPSRRSPNEIQNKEWIGTWDNLHQVGLDVCGKLGNHVGNHSEHKGCMASWGQRPWFHITFRWGKDSGGDGLRERGKGWGHEGRCLYRAGKFACICLRSCSLSQLANSCNLNLETITSLEEWKETSNMVDVMFYKHLARFWALRYIADLWMSGNMLASMKSTGYHSSNVIHCDCHITLSL